MPESFSSPKHRKTPEAREETVVFTAEVAE